MATFTTKYGLKKPDTGDFYDIADFNGNADKVDAALGKKPDKPLSFTPGHFPALLPDGNLGDSGKTGADFFPRTAKPQDIGAEAQGAAAAVQSALNTHGADGDRHCSPLEKSRLATALTTADVVVSQTEPPGAPGRIWIKVVQ